MVALLSTATGALLGSRLPDFLAGSWLDEIVIWLMGVLDSIPFYLFVAAIVFALQDSPYSQCTSR